MASIKVDVSANKMLLSRRILLNPNSQAGGLEHVGSWGYFRCRGRGIGSLSHGGSFWRHSDLSLK